MSQGALLANVRLGAEFFYILIFLNLRSLLNLSLALCFQTFFCH
jgi:hypothetical protein